VFPVGNKEVEREEFKEEHPELWTAWEGINCRGEAGKWNWKVNVAEPK